MRVTHLSLSEFRNYEVAEVPFKAGPNLIVGRNGQGKTNLVEAIAYFASLSSHRVSGDTAMMRAGSTTAVARMKVAVEDRDVLLEVQLNRDKANRAQINKNAVRPRELTRWFSCVVFAPEDLALVKGDPSTRRRFLDEAVAARNPVFAGVLSDYDRVVRQRTTLLKSARFNSGSGSIDATLSVWDDQLVQLGARIMDARRSLIRALGDPLAKGYASIVEHDHLPRLSLIESVTHSIEKHGVSRETPQDPPIPATDVSRETLTAQFREALTVVRRQELDRGLTLVGPHRDDVLFELNNLPVKGYASHGESWSFALALRLSVAKLLREESPSGDPVIILDDVFAELDARRRTALMAEVAGFEQVIVTAAVEGDVPEGQWHRVRIEAGTVLGVDVEEVSPHV